MVKDEVVRKQRTPIEAPTPTRLPKPKPLNQILDVKASPQPVPQTTSSGIGWRSTHTDCQLEIYGRYAKPKGGLIKQLNWPAEAID